MQLSGSVEVPSRSHRYLWCVLDGGPAELVAALHEQVCGRNALVVVDGGFWTHHGASLRPLLRAAGFKAVRVLAGGESMKTWRAAGSLAAWLIARGLDRSSVVVSIGGGATSDLVGFAASVALRGVPVIHVPTTLLAMADASVGGKTGVNLPTSKNMLGTFHHPDAVFAWPAALASLDQRTYRSGLAEVVKSAALDSESSLRTIEASLQALVDRGHDALMDALSISLALKSRIVSSDPTESGERALLNLGHTFGHAWEKSSRLGLDHGEAIASGLVAEARLGVGIGATAPEVVERLDRALSELGFSPVAHALPRETWTRALTSDKKRQGGSVTMALLKVAGEGFLKKIPVTDLIEWLESSRLVEPPNRS